MSLFNWLCRYMAHFPNQIIKNENNSISYDELIYEAGNKGRLISRCKVGIYCKSELNTARAVMRCIFAEAPAVLLSPRYGEKHCRRIIEQMQINYIITDISGDIELRKINNGKLEEEHADLTNVSLILSTSGTTGAPKGSMLTSYGITANLMAIHNYLKLCANDSILIARPLYHSAALIGEFLTALINGAEVNFIEGAFNPPAIVKEIISSEITTFCSTPTMFHHISHFAKRIKNLPLKTVSVSGECLTRTVAEEMQNIFKSAKIYHVYGLTEAGPRVSCLPPEEFSEHSESVGYALPGIFAKIADESGNEMPRGESGELLLLTPSAMKGYYNQPAETENVFRNGWLHTGDIAKMDEHGRITVLCRKDDMIIRGGINIYPREIENVLCSISGVDDAVAYGERDALAGEKIRIKAAAPSMTASDLLKKCRALLPPYQWPDSVEIVDKLPRNSSGKIVRRTEKDERTGI